MSVPIRLTSDQSLFFLILSLRPLILIEVSFISAGISGEKSPVSNGSQSPAYTTNTDSNPLTNYPPPLRPPTLVEYREYKTVDSSLQNNLSVVTRREKDWS